MNKWLPMSHGASQGTESLFMEGWHHRNNIRKFVLLASVGTLVAIVTTSQIQIQVLSFGRPVNEWPRIFLQQLIQWQFWVVAMPLIIWLGRHFRIERENLIHGFAVHVPFSFLVGITHLCLRVLTDWLIDPHVQQRSFLQRLMELGYNFHVEVFIYWAILGTTYAVEYYGKYRERDLQASQLEAQLSQAQLQALKMQLHPHFLFNTLNAIAGLVRTDKSTEAVNMLSGLSDLLRRRLDQEDRQEVTLREELDFVELYLDIQQVRFSDRLKVEMVIDPETAEAPVPNLILQPLVENAILHGVSHNIGPTSLVIAADHVGESLRLRVFNSGRSISGDGQQKRKSGIGLSNTRTRLQQLYGNAQNFELRNVDGGVEAVVNIPWRQSLLT